MLKFDTFIYNLLLIKKIQQSNVDLSINNNTILSAIPFAFLSTDNLNNKNLAFFLAGLVFGVILGKMMETEMETEMAQTSSSIPLTQTSQDIALRSIADTLDAVLNIPLAQIASNPLAYRDLLNTLFIYTRANIENPSVPVDQLHTGFEYLFYSDLVGLLPFSFIVILQVIITFTLALSFIYFIYFIYLFVPKNMPMWLLPLLTVVETLSFFLRPVSLGIRLFANMLAGHILLHILAGAAWFLANITIILIIPALIIVSAIGVLELGISFLQAYIYTILLAIYLKDSLVSH
jgi:ATP synthase subunit 6